MKILFVNDYMECIGGTEVYIDALTQALRQQGHQVSHFYGSTNFKETFKQRNSLKGYSKRILNFHQLSEFRKVIEKVQPDIIHLHNIFNEVTPLIVLAAGKRPVVMTLHDYSIVQAVFSPESRNGKPCKKSVCPGCINCVGAKGMVYERIKRWIHSFFLNRINLFIAPSQYMTDSISNNSSFKPITLHNGFPLLETLPLQYYTHLLYVGRLTEDKGIRTLIDAMPLIVNQFPKAHLSIAGEGELEEKLHRAVEKMQLTKTISFLGKLSSKEILKQYQKATLVVIPSKWPENLPTVGIEATSVGRPIVATKVGGIPEVVLDGKTGILFEAQNVDQLVSAVSKLLSQPKLLLKMHKEMIKRKTDFDQDLHIKKLVSLYKSLFSA